MTPEQERKLDKAVAAAEAASAAVKLLADAWLFPMGEYAPGWRPNRVELVTTVAAELEKGNLRNVFGEGANKDLKTPRQSLPEIVRRRVRATE